MINPSPYDAPIVERGWWDAHIKPDATPVEVVEQVEAQMPLHPRLDELRKIANSWDRVRRIPERGVYACGRCLDVEWIETFAGGRGSYRRCEGPHSVGCPAIAAAIEKARKLAPKQERHRPGEQGRDL